jgi:CRP-like cAMP-binding protein
MNLVEFLVSTPTFECLSHSELEVLARVMLVRQHSAGRVFLREGERGDAVYLILEGKVLVTQLNRHSRKLEHVHTMGPGEMFGLIALIDRGTRTATCTAAGEVTTASLPVSAFDLLYRSNSAIAHHFQMLVARQLSRDMRAFNDALLDLLFGRKTELPQQLVSAPHEFGASSRPL